MKKQNRILLIEVAIGLAVVLGFLIAMMTLGPSIIGPV